MIVVVAVAVATAILLPHGLRLHRVAPVTAATLWAVALGLRAMTGVFLVLYVVFFFPATQLFNAMTHWCWHAILPVLTTHLGFNGHRLGDAVTVVPGVLLAASAISIAFGVLRAARAVRHLVTRNALGTGPRGSVIVGGAEVVLAAAGISRPRLLVSAGALVALEDDELAAGLEHERGHIQRGHRYVLLYSELCRALGRFVPGTRRAVRELTFHLERDADAWALARSHEPQALARAICKAAVSQLEGSPAVTALGGTGGGAVTRRVGQMISTTPSISRLRVAALNTTAMLGVALLVGVVATVPAAVASGRDALADVQMGDHCPA